MCKPLETRAANTFGIFVILWLTLPFLSSNGLALTRGSNMNEANKYFMTTGLMIRKAVEVEASADEVFKAWTTTEGVKTFFAANASVELAVNGDYEMYFDPSQPDGLKGSEGCKVLSFVPGEMFSFTWNAPPTMPDVRKERTWVVLLFKSLGPEKTQVYLFHLGWQVGEQWQKALKYFTSAWDVVLGRLAYRFKNGPIDWKKPYTPGQ